jgi:hypothetical protein
MRSRTNEPPGAGLRGFHVILVGQRDTGNSDLEASRRLARLAV